MLLENEESEKELPLRKRINRLTFLISSRMVNAGSNENYMSAIVLLNHAYMTAEHDQSMALKIMNVAKRIARKSWAR
jgi:hypothetical protein